MPWLIGLALLAVPVVEIFVIIQVGHAIGGWQTLGLLVLETFLGAWLVKRAGRRAWATLQSTFQSANLPGAGFPGRDLTDSGMVLIGGALLIIPGFISDVVGLFFLLPFTRSLARRLSTRFLTRRAATLTPPTFPPFIPGAPNPSTPPPPAT
ncbi:FxsA family protein [Kribbella sp.]|uniref:FxsA family protein n=1 Tax=Kribbella sp. TaxID=1871183 RepID=UPI002D46BC70|nr:FxsA family protein [Kribbella sp.]HZX06298.1 FxsA family protein [Kribbella sp.]